MTRPASDPQSARLRLNLGSGPNAPLPGWTNIDRSPNVVLDRAPLVKRGLRAVGVLSDAHMAPWPSSILRIDLRKGLPFPADSAEAIYSSHTLEHMYLQDAETLLGEARRVLAPGGTLRLALPDAEKLASDLLAGVCGEAGDPGLEFNLRLYAHPVARPPLKRRVVGAFGANIHRWQPTRSLVRRLLSSAGFASVEERQYREGSLPDLQQIEHRPDSFFFEASV